MPTLDWLNRAEALTLSDKVPYRVLDPVSEHGDGNAEDLLIQGDNLDALKALLPFYRGRVKCIFIDPPYNTKSTASVSESNSFDNVEPGTLDCHMMKVDLKKIVEGIEFQGDESQSYLKISSGEVVLFTDDVIAAAESDELLSLINGKGAFARFKHGLERFLLQETWYQYRDQALAELAKGWCRDNGIEFQ